MKKHKLVIPPMTQSTPAGWPGIAVVKNPADNDPINRARMINQLQCSPTGILNNRPRVKLDSTLFIIATPLSSQ
jgi:hypothetical protein